MGGDGEGGSVGGEGGGGEGGGGEGGCGGDAGGGIGGNMGLETDTTSCVAFRPRSAEICPATLSALRLFASVCASAAPPDWTTVIRASTASSEVEMAVMEVGSGTAAVEGVVPVT